MKRKLTLEDKIMDSTIYLILGFILIVTLYPFWYVLILSFNRGADTDLGGIYLWPRSFTFDNYIAFMKDGKWLSGTIVSVLRTVVGTVSAVAFTCLVAYGLAYRHLMYRKFYFYIIIFSMYFSGGLIPYYILLRELSLLNSLLDEHTDICIHIPCQLCV